ncbi:MAG TPA: NAD-dependent epimerase/dehydratase family protein, partial [Vicinamibacteria bacterium]
MRVLVTGAAGFVGAVLVRKLREEGHAVEAVVRPGGDRWRLEGVDVPLHAADLSDGASVEALVDRIRPEWIFHLAAHGAYPSQKDVPTMVRTNVIGTLNLVESCLRAGFEAFVNTGSSSEYGFTDHAPSEDEEPRPNSDYAATKLTTTLYGSAVAERHQVRLSTLRLYSVYGPFEEPTRLLPVLAVQGMEGKLPALVSPDVSRDFVHVDDVVEAYLAAAKGPAGVYNVGTGKQITIRDAVEMARRVLSISAEPHWGTMPDRSWDSRVWVADARKIQRELGWRPKVE